MVFTPEMAYVMGGRESEQFAKFEQLCCAAFGTLRTQGNTLVNLFSLMVPAGMPELAQREDINYLRDKLDLWSGEEAAAEELKKQIRLALMNKFKRFDNTIHILKHG